jgi:predicted RNA binding protein YcfA (HicA-like mRNA interferase family)
MIKLAQGFGFVKTRQSGSNHILIHPDIPELLNF